MTRFNPYIGNLFTGSLAGSSFGVDLSGLGPQVGGTSASQTYFLYKKNEVSLRRASDNSPSVKADVAYFTSVIDKMAGKVTNQYRKTIEQSINEVDGVGIATNAIKNQVKSLFDATLNDITSTNVGDGTTLRERASAALSEIVTQLNSKVGNKYLFAGKAQTPTNTPLGYPVLASYALKDQLRSEYTAQGVNFTTPATADAVINGYFGTTDANGLKNWFLPGDYIANDGEPISAPSAPVQVDPFRRLSISTSALPNSFYDNTDTVMRDVIRTVTAMAVTTVADFGGNTAAYQNFVSAYNARLTDLVDSTDPLVTDLASKIADYRGYKSTLTGLLKPYQDNEKALASEVLNDRRLMNFILKAQLLGDKADQLAVIRKAFTEDPTKASSLVNRLSDKRFAGAATDLRLDLGVGNLIAKKDEMVSRYKAEVFDGKLREESPDAYKARYFEKFASRMNNTFDVLGDSIIRDVVTRTLGIPQELALKPVLSQKFELEKRFNAANLKNPDFVKKFTARFLAAADSGR